MLIRIGTTQIHYTEVPVGTTGIKLILQNLYLFYRYESTCGYYRTYTYFIDTRVPMGTTELILILLIREYPRYYRAYTYFTDMRVPMGTTEINQIQKYP